MLGILSCRRQMHYILTRTQVRLPLGWLPADRRRHHFVAILRWNHLRLVLDREDRNLCTLPKAGFRVSTLFTGGRCIHNQKCVYIYVIFLKYLRFCYASITSLHSPIYIFICKYQNINMNIRMKINKYKQINYIYIYIILVCRTVCRPRSSYTHVCVCECSNIDKAFYKHLLNGVHFFGAQCPPKGSGK